MPRRTPRVPRGRLEATLAIREAEAQGLRPVARQGPHGLRLLTGAMARPAYGGRT